MLRVELDALLSVLSFQLARLFVEDLVELPEVKHFSSRHPRVQILPVVRELVHLLDIGGLIHREDSRYLDAVVDWLVRQKYLVDVLDLLVGDVLSAITHQLTRRQSR